MAENYTGKLIAIYGPPHIGKTTQVNLLEEYFNKMFGYNFDKIKYPIYDLEPSGPLLNRIIRQPDKLEREYTEIEIQKIFIQNRSDFEPRLKRMLKDGTIVVAEEYFVTSIAWGVTRGLDLDLLIELNEGAIEPDLSILLDGERLNGRPAVKNHRNEGISDEEWKRLRKVHLALAERYDWEIVNANQPVEEVQKDIIEEIEDLFD